MCQSSQAEAATAKAPKYTWRRLFRQQPVRPRLSRQVTSGARIDLNRYWSKFQEVTTVHRPQHQAFICSATSFNESRQLSQLTNNANDDNAINDNLINEQTEFGNLNIH